MEILGALGIVAFVFLAFLLMSIKNLLIICQPSEVVVFSGPNRRPGDKVGYRYIRGGRKLRLPLLEKIDRLDLTTMVVNVSVRGAYSTDGIPLNIDGVANIKIDGDPPGLDHAVERLLGKSQDQIIRLARETLEGNLRGVLATLTPQEVNEDKEKFATELIEEAEVDLATLGLTLDTLKIQTVGDDVGYLDAMGRAKSAELVRNARIAEAERTAESKVQSAENLYRTRLAQLKAQRNVSEAEANKRIVEAKTLRPAVVAEERSHIAAKIARAQASIEVQRARIEQKRLELEADVVEPARAYRSQKIADARASVASIREEGLATAHGMQQLARSWTAAGDQAREIFLLEKLRTLIGIMVGTIKDARIDQLTIVGDNGAADGGGSTAGKVASLLEQLKTAGDIDVPSLLRDLAVADRAARRLPPAVPNND